MVSDRWGRLVTIRLATAVAFVTSLVTIWSPVFAVYTVSRWLDGFAFGGYSLNGLILTTEYSLPGEMYLMTQTSLARFSRWQAEG